MMYNLVLLSDQSVEPSTYYEALKDRNWVDAINAEIEALNRNNTWIVTDLPIGRKPIGKGIDYEETFSPVVKMINVRCSINIDVQNDWPLYQLDVNNAFLYSDLSKDVYMTMPLGFNGSGTSFVALLVYVDDIVIAGSDVKKIERFKSFMKIRSNPPYPDPQLRLNIGVWMLLLVKLSGYAILPVQMFCDNILALLLAANPVFHEKSKHFEIDLHLIRENVSAGVVNTIKVHTAQQVANMFTKGLDVQQHKLLCLKLNLNDMFKA
ncbi:ribonuclease H-like domain-containing protein [Tanacetum coccineum]